MDNQIVGGDSTKIFIPISMPESEMVEQLCYERDGYMVLVKEFAEMEKYGIFIDKSRFDKIMSEYKLKALEATIAFDVLRQKYLRDYPNREFYLDFERNEICIV